MVFILYVWAVSEKQNLFSLYKIDAAENVQRS